MLINRNNYEEFFILYLDNELDAETRAEVEAFAMAHPDLGEELELLLQTRFEPDEEIQFAGKEALLKQETAENRYEEFMLLATDGELNAAQQDELAEWLAANPARQKEMAILLRTRMVPDTTIVYPNKNELYRHEEKVRPVFSIRWRRIAVAASILLATGTTFMLLDKDGNKNVESGNGPIAQIEQPANRNNTISNTQQQLSTQQEKTLIGTQPENLRADEVKGNEATYQVSIANPRHDKKYDDLAENATPYVQATNNLPSAENNPNTILASNDNRVMDEDQKLELASSVTTTRQIIYTPTVTSNTLQPLEPVYALQQEDAMMNEPVRKSKFRGFLRKVTRTVEKTTNLKATDPDDRLLIGALAIQL